VLLVESQLTPDTGVLDPHRLGVDTVVDDAHLALRESELLDDVGNLGVCDPEVGIRDGVERTVEEVSKRAPGRDVAAVVHPHHRVSNPGQDRRNTSEELGVEAAHDDKVR
jgi:hypothetical protein